MYYEYLKRLGLIVRSDNSLETRIYAAVNDLPVLIEKHLKPVLDGKDVGCHRCHTFSKRQKWKRLFDAVVKYKATILKELSAVVPYYGPWLCHGAMDVVGQHVNIVLKQDWKIVPLQKSSEQIPWQRP